MTLAAREPRRRARAALRWPATGLALAVLGAAGCPPGAGDSGAPADATSYREVAAQRGPFRIAVSASGLVRPIDRIELKSKASGQVIQLPIEVGDAIAKGELIAKLDQVEERAALAEAQAELDISRAELALAEKSFERRQQLLRSDVISQEAHDQTELDLAVARSRVVKANTALERARERMEDTIISSPVDGVILQKYVERGQIIASGVSNVGGGTPIADVADMRRVHVEAGIDEIDIGKIQVGQQAAIRADAFPDVPYGGRVVRIAPEAQVEQNVTLFPVVVEVENADGNLKSGMNATVEIVIVEEADVLTVPAAALRDDAAGPGAEPSSASVLVKNGDAYRTRQIRIGRSDHRRVEVLAGLSEGEVLGIPLNSRLKEEHDRLDERLRSRRSFGSQSPGQAPSAGGGKQG